MPKKPPPTTPVAFNVTRDEFERLQSECTARGARSLPEFVRSQVLRTVTGPSLEGVASRLDELERAIRRLAESRNSGGPDGRS